MSAEWCVTDGDGNFWEVWADTRQEAFTRLMESGVSLTGPVQVQTVEEFYGLDIRG